MTSLWVATTGAESAVYDCLVVVVVVVVVENWQLTPDAQRTFPDSLCSMQLRIKACSQRINCTELTCNMPTQLHDACAFISHARQRHGLIGCSETRTVGAQSVRAP